MTYYNYREAIKSDIREYIKDNVNTNEFTPDELQEYLEEQLWVNDSVTGNASGSYTFNRWEAREYVQDNMEIVNEMVEAGWLDKESLCDKFLNEEWEYIDVSIRCYLLGEAISEVVDELDLEEE